MKLQSLKIPGIYLLGTAVYYVAAVLIFQLQDRSYNNLGEGLARAISDIIYWAQIHVFFIFLLMGTSLIGMFITYRKSAIDHCKGFLYVFLFSSASFLFLMISGL